MSWLASVSSWAEETSVLPPAPATHLAAEPKKDVVDTSALQSDALLATINKILKRAADAREGAKDLPQRDRFMFEPIWTETREQREKDVRALLDGALAVITDAPILKLQDDIKEQRDKIAMDHDKIAALRERRAGAAETSILPSMLRDTKDSIDASIAALEGDIKKREAAIVRDKDEIMKGLGAAGLELSQDQLDLLLDGVLGRDLLKLMTAFEVAKIADKRLQDLVNQSGEDLKSARRYFAMHAALFAMLVEAQDMIIERIDKVYLARLGDIIRTIDQTGMKTRDLAQSASRDDQRRVLEANLKAQEISRRVSSFYRDYLQNQRRLLAQARDKSLFDLRVADNTYETVEASFQLKALMDEARLSFESIQKLDHPGFEQVFRNEHLKQEFETLTRKLAPSS